MIKFVVIMSIFSLGFWAGKQYGRGWCESIIFNIQQRLRPRIKDQYSEDYYNGVRDILTSMSSACEFGDLEESIRKDWQ